MPATVVQEIVDKVRQLPLEQRIAVARAVDRLTWRERWQAIEDRVSQRAELNPITDDEIDEIVRDVRRQKPLHQR